MIYKMLSVTLNQPTNLPKLYIYQKIWEAMMCLMFS